MKESGTIVGGKGWWVLAAVSLVAAALLAPARLLSFMPAGAESYRDLITQGILLVRIALVGVAVLGALSALFWRGRSAEPVVETGMRLTGRDGLAAIVLLFVAAVIRWPVISSSLWWDEMTVMVRVVRRGFPFVLVFAAEGTSHLFNTLLVWISTLLFGEGEIQIRFPAFVLGALTPAVFYLAMVRWVRRSTAVIVAFLLAVNFTLVVHSTEARGYAGAILFSFLSCVLFAEMLRRPGRGVSAGYVACSLLAVGFLIFSVIVPFSHGLLAVYRWIREGRARAAENLGAVFPCLWVGALSLLLFGFHLPQMAEYGLHRSSVDHLLAKDVAPEIARYVAGGSLFALFGVLGIGGLVAAWRGRSALAWAAGMPLLMGVVWLLVPGARFSPRFFFFAVPCLFVGVAFCFSTIAKRSHLVHVVGGISLAIALICVQLADYERFVRIGNPNLKDLASRLASHDVVLVGIQEDVNIYYFPNASRIVSHASNEDDGWDVEGAEYVVDGVNWNVHDHKKISKQGFVCIERLDSWTKALPSFLVYKRVEPAK